jgi:choline dehydrogenase
VRRILAALEFDTLAGVGVRDEHLDELTDKALDDYFLSVAPIDWSPDDVRSAYRAALAIGPSRSS